MGITKAPDKINKSVQEMNNLSFDTEFNILAREMLVYNPVADTMDRMTQISAGVAVKVTVDGDVTYVGKAGAGTAEATAGWQAMKIDETSGVKVTWADGNSKFDNVATDLTALDYS